MHAVQAPITDVGRECSLSTALSRAVSGSATCGDDRSHAVPGSGMRGGVWHAMMEWSTRAAWSGTRASLGDRERVRSDSVPRMTLGTQRQKVGVLMRAFAWMHRSATSVPRAVKRAGAPHDWGSPALAPRWLCQQSDHDVSFTMYVSTERTTTGNESPGH